MTCLICETKFKLRPGKPGLANVCEDPHCARQGEKLSPSPDKLMAGTTWQNKHTPIVTIMPTRQARAFNNAQRRFGASVICSFGPRSRPPTV